MKCHYFGAKFCAFSIVLVFILLFRVPVIGQYVMVGKAIYDGANCYALTRDSMGHAGAIWHQHKLDLQYDFRFEADLYFGDADGADGIAFVLQDTCSNILGTAGGGLGYFGITPSLAVEFDTYRNPELSDIIQDHVAIQRNGTVKHIPGSGLPNPVPVIDLEDNRKHRAVIEWKQAVKTLTVSLDGIQVMQYTDDIVQKVFKGASKVHWGFTAATGESTNLHRVCMISTAFTPDIPYTVTPPTDCYTSSGRIVMRNTGPGSPFTFKWSTGNSTSNTLSNLSEGLYMVTVTDRRGCGNKYQIPVLASAASASPNLLANCPQDIKVQADPDGCGAFVSYDFLLSDDCPGISISRQGDYFPVGTTEASVILYYYGEPADTCRFPVTVGGAQPQAPRIVCPQNIQVNTLPNTCLAVVDFEEPVVIDNCPGTITRLMTPLGSGSSFEAGEHIVIYEAQNPSGLTSTCEFSIKVIDNENPVLRCPDNISVVARPGETTAKVNYDMPELLDNCNAPFQVLVAGLPSGADFPIGITAVKYVAEDQVVTVQQSTIGTAIIPNRAVCEFYVEVRAGAGPSLRCPEVTALYVTKDRCSAVAGFPQPVIVAGNSSQGATQVEGLPSGSEFPVGTTINRFVIPGTEAACVVRIEVLDTFPPSIDCPPNRKLLCGATDNPDVTGRPLFSDNCGFVNLGFKDQPSAVVCTGNTVFDRVWTVTDSSGNINTCVQTIQKLDEEPPVFISCPPDSKLECRGLRDRPMLLPEIKDRCDPEPVLTFRDSVISGDSKFIHVIKRVWMARDQCGNTSTCSQQITSDYTAIFNSILNRDANGDRVPDGLFFGVQGRSLYIAPGQGACIQQWFPASGNQSQRLTAGNQLVGSNCKPGTNTINTNGRLNNSLLAEVIRLQIMLLQYPGYGGKRLNNLGCSVPAQIRIVIQPNTDLNTILRFSNGLLGSNNLQTSAFLNPLAALLRCINSKFPDVCDEFR